MEHIHGLDVSWMTHGNPKGSQSASGYSVCTPALAVESLHGKRIAMQRESPKKVLG
jgi:hypothetical protein